MVIKGITKRWLLNSLGVILLVMVALVGTLSFAIRSYIYNGIQQAVNGRAEELTNVFADYGRKSPKDFIVVARNYVENFPNKESMELMVFNSNGRVVTTSVGFAPDESQQMPDYRLALASLDGSGTWTGELNSGEKVFAVTRVMRNSLGAFVGGIRYVVSLEEADKQVAMMVGALIVGGLVVILFVVSSSYYFMRSIILPVRDIGATAKRIAQGDFKARIEKIDNDDEIGQLCETINEMAVELGAAEKMKNDFISSVSHELRTPLTAIKGWAETIQSGGVDGGTYEKGMNVIIRESERLSGIVEELLDFSRMQSGRMVLMMDRIDILAELGEAVYLFSDRAKAENKFLLYEEPAMLSPVLGDINRLRQVFINVLDNALKYTEVGGTVQVTAAELEGFIHVVISDNGCGIPAEHLPNVKKKFYKANQTIRGSGIGLALADEIMILHSGRLEVESHEEVGTAVTIIIPTLRHLEEKPGAAFDEKAEEISD